MTDSLFGIEELVARAEARVADAGVEVPNAAVAEALTIRNVRYYATLGLLTPPTARRGRHALYDDSHVDQLVAIKRLQGEGRQLAEIQRALVGLAPDEVARIAAGESVPLDRFWALRAADHAPPGPSGEDEAAAAAPDAAAISLSRLPQPGGPPAAPAAGARALTAARRTPDPGASVDAAAPGAAAHPVTPPPYPDAVATVYALGQGVALHVPTGLTLTPAAAARVLDAARAVLFPAAPPAAPDAPLHPLIAPKSGPNPQEHRR